MTVPHPNPAFPFIIVLLIGYFGSSVLKYALGITYHKGVSKLSIYLYNMFWIILGILLKITLDLSCTQR